MRVTFPGRLGVSEFRLHKQFRKVFFDKNFDGDGPPRVRRGQISCVAGMFKGPDDFNEYGQLHGVCVTDNHWPDTPDVQEMSL